ncbi:hypothetical protein [Streptomyces sp. NPDC059783]|uniref:hypothetical protein n=1 Tax=Streptomyces sp. NPDC059783 TaxID=3346944 RepID=UPI0036556226
MTTTQETTPSSATAEDGLCRAVADLVVVFENLGPEHQALRAEEVRTAARERRGTLVRMGDGIHQAAHAVAVAIETLATADGLRDLGIHWQYSKTADGDDYTAPPGRTEIRFTTPVSASGPQQLAGYAGLFAALVLLRLLPIRMAIAGARAATHLPGRAALPQEAEAAFTAVRRAARF